MFSLRIIQNIILFFILLILYNYYGIREFCFFAHRFMDLLTLLIFLCVLCWCFNVTWWVTHFCYLNYNTLKPTLKKLNYTLIFDLKEPCCVCKVQCSIQCYIYDINLGIYCLYSVTKNCRKDFWRKIFFPLDPKIF